MLLATNVANGNTKTELRRARKAAASAAADAAEAVTLSQRRVEWSARGEALAGREGVSLNESLDNAISEAFALAEVLPNEDVCSERALLARTASGSHCPGTPDGAALVAGGLHAVQVVRAPVPKRGGCAKLVRVLLEKVVKSLHWLLHSPDLNIIVFTVALWVPRGLSRRALGAIKRALRRSALFRPARNLLHVETMMMLPRRASRIMMTPPEALLRFDPRFDFVLLVPATDELRAAIFPRLFGLHAEQRGPRLHRDLVLELRELEGRFSSGEGDSSEELPAWLLD